MKIRGVSFQSLALVAALALIASAPMSRTALADPTPTEQATTSLINALVAAVLDVTDSTTDENVVPNSEAISALLPSGAIYRLLDASGEPLNRTNRPRRPFERNALLILGDLGDSVQEERGGKLLTVYSLGSAATAVGLGCATCHENYEDLENDVLVGAISVQMPLLPE